MSEIRDVPAFPQSDRVTKAISIADSKGMSLRDYFARGAMQELMRDGSHPNVYHLARSAYTVADAMLVVRAEDE